MKKKGIDISYHQGTVDFDLVKKNGIEFVILRAGYRDKEDVKFPEYVRGARAAGLEILGVYFFSYALNIEEVKKEAKLCAEIIEMQDLSKDLMVFYDFEYDTVKKAKQKGVDLTKKECNDHTKAFCEEIRRLGYKPGIYTNLDYYKNWYDKPILQEYPIWLADYTGGPDHKCLLQQYTDAGKVEGIKTNVDMNYYYGEEFKMEGKNISGKKTRTEVVKLAKSWVGKNESDGSFKSIIDIYNSHTPRPRGVKMTYTAPWCATTWSALAIALGYTDIMPIECSCGELIKKAKKMGIWIEDDSYQASSGDAILYDWEDDGKGDNIGWPDHVGVIEKVSNGEYTVIEGNKNDAVGRRTVKINGKFIRGFITPKYEDCIEHDMPTLSEKSDSEPEKWIVTAFSLNVREEPTKDSRSLKIVSKGEKLIGTGKVKIVSGKKWVEVEVPKLNKLGWCSEGSNGEVYLKKVRG